MPSTTGCVYMSLYDKQWLVEKQLGVFLYAQRPTNVYGIGLAQCAFFQRAPRKNEAPRSKLRGVTELKHSELSKIFLRLPLPLHIPFDSLPVSPFSYLSQHMYPSVQNSPPIGPVSPQAFYEISRAP